MRKFFVFAIVLGLTVVAGCQKQQTEAEKNAEVERQVQERLAAEHQAQQQQELEQRQSDLDTREKALAEKENVATATPEAEQPVAAQRTRRESESRGQTAGYSTFYTNLEPYGSWLETNDYGYVWQPREAESSRTWRPYTNGRWVYTDAGWTWISQERFGWATYHYGRWTRLRGVGWVWVPGEQWAPAWVSWRKSKDFVGWAPLPPEARFDRSAGIHNWADNYYDIGPDQYSFVPTQQFGSERVESAIVPPERNVTIVNETTNVTNITYKNTTIINEGPNYEELRTQSREPLQRYRLERNASINVNTEPGRPVIQGQAIVVAAPVFEASQQSERPPTVKRMIAQATVDLGWAAIGDHEAAKKTREKMKSEAVPPSNPPPKKFVKTASTTSAPAEVTGATSTSASTVATPSPSATMASAGTPSATATSTPAAPRTTPRRPASLEQSTTPAGSTSAISSASPSPSASQRRGRLLIPNTPVPRMTPSTTSTPAASNSPSPTATVSSREIATPTPSALSSATSGVTEEQPRRGRFQSQAQRFAPRKTVPMTSPSVTPTPRSATQASPALGPSVSPSDKLTKKEKKEQNREEREELKRERQGLGQQSEVASPSPHSSP